MNAEEFKNTVLYENSELDPKEKSYLIAMQNDSLGEELKKIHEAIASQAKTLLRPDHLYLFWEAPQAWRDLPHRKCRALIETIKEELETQGYGVQAERVVTENAIVTFPRLQIYYRELK